MKHTVTLILILLLCLFLSGCQDAQLSTVQEKKPTEQPSPTPYLPTLPPETTMEEKNDFYRIAVEKEDHYVHFSADDGFYSKNITLTLTSEGASDIFYTDDGSDPDPKSICYTHPLSLIAANVEIPRCYVIRARAYYPDGTKSPVFTHTYFLDTKIKSHVSIPVFSLIGPPDELTSGPNALLVGSRALDTGEYASRDILLQMFLSDGTEALNQPSILRVYGESSRKTPVKSLRLMAGTGENAEEQAFSYSFFGTFNAQGKAMDHYSQFVLSNSEEDFQYAFLRDEFAQRLAKSAFMQDYEDIQPAVVYINGIYYGLHWLHEYYSNDFFQAVYGASEGRYAVVDWKAKSGASALEQDDAESAARFQAAYEQLLAADFQSEEGQELLRRLIDVENYLDYCALNIVIDNANWPFQMQAYAYISPDEDEQSIQWRFLPHAMSNSFGLKGGKNPAEADTLGDVLNPESSRFAPLFAKLMEVEEYRTYFVEKVSGLLADQWSKDAMLSTLKELHNARNSEMQRYLTRIETLRKTRNSGVWMKKNDFNTAYSTLSNYVKSRPDAILRQLEQYLPNENQEEEQQTE